MLVVVTLTGSSAALGERGVVEGQEELLQETRRHRLLERAFTTSSHHTLALNSLGTMGKLWKWVEMAAVQHADMQYH